MERLSHGAPVLSSWGAAGLRWGPTPHLGREILPTGAAETADCELHFWGTAACAGGCPLVRTHPRAGAHAAPNLLDLCPSRNQSARFPGSLFPPSGAREKAQGIGVQMTNQVSI